MIGKTKDVGFQVGVRKTIPVNIKAVWGFLLSERGQELWLGRMDEGNLLPGSLFKTIAGTTGKVSVFKENSHLRTAWHMSDDPVESKLQVRVIPSGQKTVISFHQEKLKDNAHREKMKQHWMHVLDRLSLALTA